MTTHSLKTWPGYFDDLASGKKTFELRLNDRDFKVGDTLLLHCWCPATGKYVKSREGFVLTLVRDVTHILHGGRFGLEEGYIVMSLKEIGR